MPEKVKIHLKDEKLKNDIVEKVYQYRHFENMYIILLQQDYNQKRGDFNLLTNYRVMRAVLRDTEGGKVKKDVAYIKEKYKNHQLMRDLIEISDKLKIHNLVAIMRRVKSQYKSFFTKTKQGVSASPPKTKKLSKLTHYTLPLDSYKSYTLKKENQLGVNLNDRMQYTHVNHEELSEVVNLEGVKSVNINYSNGEIYFLVSYEKDEFETEEKEYKSAGLDIGINNLVALYVDDDETPSLIIDGKKYKTYNANFNRFLAKVNESIANCGDEDRKKYLINYRSFLYEKRNRFFFDQFHKLSKRILEYLYKYDVTELVISENLNELKNNGQCKLMKKVKQSFIQIPFGKLLKNLKYKAKDFGIKIVVVDEKYTSKTSSLSADILEIHEISDSDGKVATDAFSGKRVQRGLFLDTVLNVAINADLNGAFNICKLGRNLQKNIKKGERWLKEKLKKLCNPIKVSSDFELCQLLT